MSYETATALRMALEQRLRDRAKLSVVSVDRLRRRVVFERVVARVHAAAPGRWVLKGGMAMEVRLRDAARLTKDIDLGLRDQISGQDRLRDRLIEALSVDPFEDQFLLAPGAVTRLMEDGAGQLTWRTKVAALLAGKPFGTVQLDISPRAHELEHTDRIALPNSMDFAGIGTPTIEIIDVHRHAAEKYHALARQFPDRKNTRVRDLVDVVILVEHGLLTPQSLAAEARQVWSERDRAEPPSVLPSLPPDWLDRYERIATEHDLTVNTFTGAVALAAGVWAEAFPG